VAVEVRKPVNILVVDDRDENLVAVEAVLSDPGYRLVRARSGREALKEVLDQDFALILLDVVMPGVDGYETATLIRERPRSRQTPIIFLTANDWGSQHVFRGYTVGAVDYLVKPVPADVLRSKVAVFVELFNRQEALRIAQEELEQRVADRTRELADTNVVLSAEIEERSRIERERVEILRREQAARLEAERANRLKDEFLATLSHELRTPLNAILGWVQMLQTGELAPSRARQAVDVIGRNARLQAQLIEDILDVSRIITGKLDIERAPVSMSQLLDTVVTDIAPAVAAKGVVFTSDVAATLPPIEGDAKRLYQVLNNVLSNAVKFTGSGGTIDLRCDADENWLQIDIRDSGIGIAPEFLPHVFDRFRQADSRSTRLHGGLGLGLAIAKHLVDMHAGTIQADSRGAGSGTLISIRLPAAPGLRSTIEPGSELTATSFQLQDATLLLVDDETDSREMLAALLEQRGATILECDSAEEALDVLSTAKVHLLIADIAMPGVDGYELMRRARTAGCSVPGIAVTAFARPDDRRRALESGYTTYLAKPVDGLELARTVRDLLVAQRVQP